MFVSCEKVVELDLGDAEQMLVVEGIVHDSLGDNFVQISKSKPFNDNNGGFEQVSGAIVSISDNSGNNYLLTEIEPGKYNSNTLKGVSGRTYTLQVNIAGKIVYAQSYLPSKVELDSLSYEKINAPFGGSDNEKDQYRVFTHFHDPENVVNYYRFKPFTGSEQSKGFLSLDDRLIEGDDVDFPMFLTEYEEGDTATIQLLSVDEANYRYFNAIDASQNGEVPGNPETNLVGENVVGYFGAYAKSEKSLVIIPIP